MLQGSSDDGIPAPANFQAHNDATVVLKPADEVDPDTEANCEAVYQFEKTKPTFHPVEEDYKADKYGLYSSLLKRVGSKGNVSSYEMSSLLDDESITDIRYETATKAHAYGRTISNLNEFLQNMTVTDNGETFTVKAGSWTYVFNKAARTYSRTGDVSVDVNEQTYGFELPEGELREQDVLRIAGDDISRNYYGQTALSYILDDKTLQLTDIMTPNVDLKTLGKDDYQIDFVDYTYTFRNFTYDPDKMEFNEGEDNAGYSQSDDENTLHFFVCLNDGTEAVEVAAYNVKNGTANITRPDLVKSLNGSRITFVNSSNNTVTGYRIETKNKYFYIDLNTKPSLTIKPGSTLKAKINELYSDTENKSEKKFGLKNTATWSVTNNEGWTKTFRVSGTDYIADIVRHSDISKKRLGEKASVTGQDGNIYKSGNDPLNGQYLLVWQVNIAELADGVEVKDENGNSQIMTNVPVAQQSGVFYDLLPSHSDIIEGSVNVYVDAGGDVNAKTAALDKSEFEVLERIDNWNDSGRKLLIIKVDAPCDRNYYVTYATVHSHDDIQDYGSQVLNTVAYQTGNADIGEGYPDNGGDRVVSLSEYMKNLDQPDNGKAKRFIYAEASEKILALFPTSSGIYKKVATRSNPSFGKSGTVHSGETYTYNVRMQNDSSTKAVDIAILDSIENYGNDINSGGSKSRSWYGNVVGFDLSAVKEKMRTYYEEEITKRFYKERNIPPIAQNDSTVRKQLKEYLATDAVKEELAQKLSALKVFVYTGDSAVDLESDQYSDSQARKELLNNILNSNTAVSNWSVLDEENWSDVSKQSGIDSEKISAFIVYTGEDFILGMGGSISFTVTMKAPRSPNATAETYDHDTVIQYPVTYNNIYRSFTNQTEKIIPSGIESQDDTVETKRTYFYTHYDYTQLKFAATGNLEFSKLDSETGKAVQGVKYKLYGTSDYGTSYNETLTSNAKGSVQFKNLERGVYTLVETTADANHVIDNTERQVVVDYKGDILVGMIQGLTREYVTSDVSYTDASGKEITVKDADCLKISGNNIEIEPVDSEGSVSAGSQVKITEGKLITTGILVGTGADYYILYNFNETLENDPRYHGEFEFTKTDSLTGEGVAGASFRLKGVSEYQNNIDLTATSDYNGVVSFGDLEIGTYTLTEVSPAKGYMTMSPESYKVTGSGKTPVVFKINGITKLDDSGRQCIDNTPLGNLKIYKTDSITGNPISKAEFELVSNPDLVSRLAGENYSETALKAMFTTAGFAENTDNTYSRTITQSNETEGVFSFDKLPLCADGSGVYILQEKSADNHKVLSGKVTITFENGVPTFRTYYSDDSKFLDYVSFNESTHKYEKTDTAASAECIRIKNDPEFGDKKAIIKSWVGKPAALELKDGLYTTFPVLHLSSSEPEVLVKTATFSSALKTMVQAHKSTFTGIDKVDKSAYSDWTDALDVDNSDDDTELLIRFDDATGKLQYCTNARTVNMPVDCSYLFDSCVNENFTSLDLSNFGFDKTTTMARMFDMSLVENDKDENYRNLFDCNNPFTYSKLEEIKFPKDMNTELVTSTYRMFAGCNALKSLDLSGFDTNSVKEAMLMFGCCAGLEKLVIGENFTFDALVSSRTGNWKQPFYGMVNLKEFIGTEYLTFSSLKEWANMFQYVGYKVNGNTLKLDLSGLSSDKVTNITNMFCNCGAKEILIENLDARIVTEGHSVFYNASNLTTLKLGEKFTLEKAGSLYQLFRGDKKLTTLEGLQYIKGSSSGNFAYMFADIQLSTLDISGMTPNFSKNLDLYEMFVACSNLTTIYVNPDAWPTLDNSGHKYNDNNMFKNSPKLVGGAGTVNPLNISRYNWAQYAHVDGGASNPGLFTDIANKTTATTNSINPSNRLMSVHSKAAGMMLLGSEVSEEIFPPDLKTFHFTKSTETDSYSEKALDGATDDDLGVKYSYEYFTGEGGTKISDTQYSVPETVRLTVTKTVKEGDAYIAKSQVYDYVVPAGEEPLTAVWKQVGDTEDGEWICDFKVIDNEAQMFGWESNVGDLTDPDNSDSKYKTKQNVDHPISTKGENDPNAVITNVQGDNKVGSISINKKISGFETGSDLEDKIEDEFEIKVTVKKKDGTKYTKSPFDENGEYTFFIRPGDEPVVISGLPENSTYTVTEIRHDKRSDGSDNFYSYTYVSGNVTDGKVKADTVTAHEIENTLGRSGLTISKTASMQKYNWTSKTYETPADDDEDYTQWKTKKFKFTVSFMGLIPGDEYSYSIGGGTAVKSGESLLTFDLSSGESVVFTGLPEGASYSVTEVEKFENTIPEDEDSIDEVSDIYKVLIDNNEKTAPYERAAEKLTGSSASAEFTNDRHLKKPETVDLKVFKRWETIEGHEITWLTDADGKYSKMSWNGSAFVVDKDGGSYIPVDKTTNKPLVDSEHRPTVNIQNFLKVVVGRGLYDSKTQKLYEQEPEYMPATLNYKNFWSYDFNDLPKYGKLKVGTTEQILPYVYYVTEFEVTGFKNANGTSADYNYTRNTYSEQMAKEASFLAEFTDDEASLTFVNKQIKTYSLSLEKQVRGNFGSKIKEFSFTIEFRDEYGMPLNSTGLMRLDMDGQGNVTQTARTVTIEGGVYSDALPDNTVIKFLNVPEGTQFTITESAQDAAGYDIKYKLNDGDPVEGNSVSGEMDENKAYVFINTLEGELPTGIILDVATPIVLLIWIGGWFVYLRKSERREEKDI